MIVSEMGYDYFRLLWKSGAVSSTRVRERALERRESLLTVLQCARPLAPGTPYWVCRAEEGLVGTCGIEVGDRCALLRSVCVMERHRGRSIAEQLIGSALQEAIRLELPGVYLLSKDTGGYFERLGWREVPVAELAARLPGRRRSAVMKRSAGIPMSARSCAARRVERSRAHRTHAPKCRSMTAIDSSGARLAVSITTCGSFQGS